MSDFDNPRNPPDNATVFRPRPGGGARKGPEGVNPEPPPRPAAALGTGDVRLEDFVATGKNRLLSAAGPLLALGGRLQQSVFQADVPALRREAIKAVEQFDAQCRVLGVADDDAKIARYILCTFVDSAVFRTPWGAQSDWASRSLLFQFHQEMVGGEKFFQILERLEPQVTRYIDLMELQYVCLLLGFEGRYQGGAPGLTDLRERIGTLIRRQRGSAVSALSVRWQGVQDQRSRVVRLVPWWVVGIAGLVLALGLWLVLRSALSASAAPLRANLAAQGLEPVAVVAAVPSQASRLKQLLKADEDAKVLTVEEQGGRSVVTLQGTQVFSSGSAVLSESSFAVVRDVAAALDQVGGSVVVIGHTDDQPVRSLRFQDNFELSRARALTVARLLKESMTSPISIEWTGLGETQPKFLPASDPGNRALNRRVEIIHSAVATGSAP